MYIKTATSDQIPVRKAILELAEQLGTESPSLLIVYFNANINGRALTTALNAQWQCPLVGATSHRGAMIINADEQASNACISLMAIYDSQGHYGVGASTIQGKPQAAATKAFEAALAQAGDSQGMPALLWCALPPGNEESILEQLQELTQYSVPIIGGSSADNDISGLWQQIYQEGADSGQIVIAALFPSGSISYTCDSGYTPTQHSAVVTKAHGRVIYELDNKPAAMIYNHWLNGQLNPMINGGDILALTTAYPLGRNIDSTANTAPGRYLLCHPDSITENQGITLFATVAEGETVTLMKGSRHTLITHTQKMIDDALAQLPKPAQPLGMVMIYCAGCAMALDGDLNGLTASIAQAHQKIPLIGNYTYGEQGYFLDNRSRHGNMMTSVVVFGH